jgi:hypothetical protein
MIKARPYTVCLIFIFFILDDILHSSLERLIFDCLSFTEGLITCLSIVESDAPASSNTSVTSLWPFDADRCSGVLS